MTGAYKYLGHDVRNEGQFKQLLNNPRQFTSKPGQENSKRIKLKSFKLVISNSVLYIIFSFNIY